MTFSDDEGDTVAFQEVGENEFQQIKNKATKLGYADGVNDGRESVFQKGFDQGYKDGICTSFDLDKFKYLFQNLNQEKVKNEVLLEEKLEYDKLKIVESKSPQHFQYLKHQDDNLNMVSRKQQEYVEEIKQQCAQKLPMVTNLLKAHSLIN